MSPIAVVFGRKLNLKNSSRYSVGSAVVIASMLSARTYLRSFCLSVFTTKLLFNLYSEHLKNHYTSVNLDLFGGGLATFVFKFSILFLMY